ncbi:unnamed protein product [Sphagnum balticum]
MASMMGAEGMEGNVSTVSRKFSRRLRMMGATWVECLLILRTKVAINSFLTISKRSWEFFTYSVSSSSATRLTLSNLEMSPGFTDFRKKVSFYLFLQKTVICGTRRSRSPSIPSTGLLLSLNPFARMWARYLLSLESSATDSLTLKP